MSDAKWRNFYGVEAERYERARYGSRYGRAFRSAHRDVVLDLIAKLPACRYVLDVASGTGQLLPSLRVSAEFLVACDLTPEMMWVSRDLHGSDKVGYVQANALKLPFSDETFDTVSSSRFLHLFPIEMQQGLLREMHRVVKPGGFVLVDVYNKVPRRLLGLPIALYRKLRRKRPEMDYYASPSDIRDMLDKAGLTQIHAHGAGSYFAAPFLWLPEAFLARLLRLGLFANRLMAEQWVVIGRRR